MSELGQKLIATVRAVAAERPDFVYKAPVEIGEDGNEYHTANCVYVHKGAPSCIIGQALWRLGLIDASFEDGTANDTTVYALIENRRVAGLDTLDDDEVEWLRAVQRNQDGGDTWADSVANADEESA